METMIAFIYYKYYNPKNYKEWSMLLSLLYSVIPTVFSEVDCDTEKQFCLYL